MRLLLLAVVFVVAGCGFTNTKTEVQTQTVTVTRTVTHTVTTTSSSSSSSDNACAASDLTGTFSVLEGSAGAGNIVYTLHVTNASQAACYVSGIPQAQLLDANGTKLETSNAPNGSQTSAKAVLQPGASASAQARFSPDVDPCGKTPAEQLQVTFGRGTLGVRLDPPTRVCNHGALQWSSFTTAD